RRKDAVFSTTSGNVSFDQAFAEFSGSGAQGVEVSQVRVDEGEPERRYLPGHPDADPQGYVAFPRINPAEEMVDLMGASRGYQANVAAISSVKDMIARSIDLFK